MANSWLKLYHEMLNDPKMGTMTDHLYRRTIEIFLLAGQEGRNGLLPPLTQIAWALRTTVNDATLCLQEMAELGIVTKLPDGNMIVTNFAERQDTKLSDAERQQRRRDKAKTSRASLNSRHADDVTPVTQTVTQTVTQQSRTLSDGETEIVTLDKDKDKDKEEDKEEELINNAAKAAAREKAGRQKLTPDKSEFWLQAFGPESERAQAFSRASGIIPLSGEFGRWQKDLRQFSEAGISIQQMIRAVEKVRKDGKYPIKAPGTVLTEARNLEAAKQQQAKRSGGFDDYAAELNGIPRQSWDVEL